MAYRAENHQMLRIRPTILSAWVPISRAASGERDYSVEAMVEMLLRTRQKRQVKAMEWKRRRRKVRSTSLRCCKGFWWNLEKNAAISISKTVVNAETPFCALCTRRLGCHCIQRSIPYGSKHARIGCYPIAGYLYLALHMRTKLFTMLIIDMMQLILHRKPKERNYSGQFQTVFSGILFALVTRLEKSLTGAENGRVVIEHDIRKCVWRWRPFGFRFPFSFDLFSSSHPYN